MAFAKTIEQKYVVKVIQNNKRRLQRNVFMFDRRKQRKISDTAIHLIKRLNDLSNGLITGKQLKKKLKQYLNLDVSESNHGTARNEKFTVTRQERNFHCINIVLKKFH